MRKYNTKKRISLGGSDIRSKIIKNRFVHQSKKKDFFKRITNIRRLCDKLSNADEY